MKKAILSLFAAAIATAAMAQNVAPEIGLNLANLKLKDNSTSVSEKYRPGLMIGGNLEFPVSKNIFIDPGLFYKMTGTTSSTDGNPKLKINTLEIPVNAYYKFDNAGGNRFSIGVGAYVAMNLSGKIVTSGYTDVNGNAIPAQTITMKFGSGQDDDLKTLDAGLALNAAYELKNGLFFHARYQFGLSNLQPAQPVGYYDLSIKSYALSFSAGYWFKSKPVKKKMTEKKANN